MSDKPIQVFSEVPDEWYDEEGNVIMPSYTQLSSEVQPWPFSSTLIFLKTLEEIEERGEIDD